MDGDGFEAWYRREHPRLISALAIAAGNVGVAAEAADEAFTRAFERWERVRVMESPGGWTYRTALNVLRRRWRRGSLERRASSRVDVIVPAEWSSEVWDAVRRLPIRERTAVALRYVADLTTEEIANVMGVAPGTVGSTLHAARQHLAAALAPEQESEHA